MCNDLPLLLSKEAMENANTQIDFASDKINILLAVMFKSYLAHLYIIAYLLAD